MPTKKNRGDKPGKSKERKGTGVKGDIVSNDARNVRNAQFPEQQRDLAPRVIELRK